VKKIKCTLSTIQDAIDALDKYERKLQQKNRQFLDKLSDVGVKTAESGFMSAQYDGEYSITVSKQFEESTVYVVASGEAVAFIEFGTGIYYPDEHPFATQPWMRHGSWSTSEMGKGHWDDKRGWWYDTGGGEYVNTHGNPANMSFYNAAVDMKSRARETAMEVFRND
jgi:hypothetical protein